MKQLVLLKKLALFSIFTLICALIPYGCNGTISKVTVTSSAFGNGDFIPEIYSCKGTNISPPLSFSADDSTTGVQSMTLIVEDPDAPVGIFVHWVLFNLPGNITELPQNFPSGAIPAEMSYNTGKNSFGDQSYGGPCPPSGREHRYYFRIYLLNTTLNLPDGAARQQVVQAMTGHIVARGELMGRFSR